MYKPALLSRQGEPYLGSSAESVNLLSPRKEEAKHFRPEKGRGGAGLSMQGEAQRGDKFSRGCRLTLGKQERLKRSQEFARVYLRGRRICGPHLILNYLPNRLGRNRLGVAVSRKRCRLSTRRHLVLRRLRAAYRQNKWRFLPGYDIVLSPRGREIEKVHFAGWVRELLQLAEKAGLLSKGA